MTIIVYDGTQLVVDRAAVSGDLKYEIPKSIIANGEIVTGVGLASQLSTLRQWYLDGADPKTYPAFQAVGERQSELVVCNSKGIQHYERTAEPIEHGHYKCAFGAGYQLAYGALAAGASAVRAARIVSQFHPVCGCGLDVYWWQDGEDEPQHMEILDGRA